MQQIAQTRTAAMRGSRPGAGCSFNDYTKNGEEWKAGYVEKLRIGTIMGE